MISVLKYSRDLGPICNAVPHQIRVSYNEGASTTLLKPSNSSLTYPQKRRSKMSSNIPEPKKPSPSECRSPFNTCTTILAAALAIAILIIAFLLLRGPSYVYTEYSPTAGNSDSLPNSIDLSTLRPLPTVINLNERIEADILPKHSATTEIFIPTASRIMFNVSLGGSAQLALLSRHFVPPTLAYHDFLLPLRAETPATTYKILERKARRHVNPNQNPQLSVVHEQFMLAGKHYLTIVNDRSRVEPLSIVISQAKDKSSGKDPTKSGSVCPVLCSGNGVFSGGQCVCFPGYKGRECDLRTTWCEVADCNGHGRCTAEGVCKCDDPEWTGDACEKRACPHPTCNDRLMDFNFDFSEVSARQKENATVPMAGEVTIARFLLTSSLRNELRNRHRPAPYNLKDQIRTRMNRKRISLRRKARRTDAMGMVPSMVKAATATMVGLVQAVKISSVASVKMVSAIVGCVLATLVGWVLRAPFDNAPLGVRFMVAATKTVPVCAKEDGMAMDVSWKDVQVRALEVESVYSDGLTDCDDPECCSVEYCKQESFCQASLSPSDVLLRLPTIQNAPFYDRVQFLVKNDSVQNYAEPKQYDPKMAAVVRGRVLWRGSGEQSNEFLPLMGVRVSDANHPLYGFTLSRSDGYFDLLVNGGRSVSLVFMRNQFQRERRTVFVPPNAFLLLDDVVMGRDKEALPIPPARPNCTPSLRKLPEVVVRPAWKIADHSISSSRRSGVFADTRNLVESFQLADTSVNLVYDSSRASSSHSTLIFNLLDSKPDESLKIVHVKVKIAGRLFHERLAPKTNLTYTFEWDKQNAYRQYEYGLVPAEASIGYEYQNCDRAKELVWIRRSAKMQGAIARTFEASAWSLDIHHHLDSVHGILEFGNGDARFLKEDGKAGSTILGSKALRNLDCDNSCNAKSDVVQLFRPTALANGLDGSVFVGDHNLIRHFSPGTGFVRTILSLSQADTSHSYYLAVHPSDGSLYVSLPLKKQIWKIANLESDQVQNNYEVIVGDGAACVGVSDSCGDGGPASQAQLFFPKGIAFDRNGNLFVADGRRLRVVDASGFIRSINNVSPEGPPSCDSAYFGSSIGNLKLEWPSSLSIHLSSGLLYVLDSNIVYELDPEQDTSKVLLGVFPTCPNSTSLPVKNAKDIVASPEGNLFVLESDGKKINQVRTFSPEMNSLSSFSGGQSACSCDTSSCLCDENDKSELSASSIQFNAPSSISIDSLGNVFIADSGNAKIKKIHEKSIKFDPIRREFSIPDPDTNELFLFNRHGQHISTQSLISGKAIYNFTYDVETKLGKLTAVHGAGGLLLRVIRVNDSAVQLEAPSGQRTTLTIDPYDQTLTSIQQGTWEPVRFTYSNGGLMLMKTQKGGDTVAFEYDESGKIKKVVKDSEIWNLDEGNVINNRISTDIRRNGKRHARITIRPEEESFYGEDGAWSRASFMGEGMQLTIENVTSVLHQGSSQLHDEKVLLKKRTTIGAIQNPNRRSLSTKWDWKYFTKVDDQRRVAEVGHKKMVNGVNVYSLVYNRKNNTESVLLKNDEPLFNVEYSEYGSIKKIYQPLEESDNFKVAEVSINYDSLGRRSEITWGERKISEKYDRQNRMIEKIQKDGDAWKFAYSKYPFTKKPFMLAIDENKNILEWMSTDEQHHVLVVRDDFGREITKFENGVEFSASCWDRNGKALCLKSQDFSTSSTLQGPLIVLQENSHTVQNRKITSSFAYEYDDLLRVLSMTYDEKFGTLSEIAGFEIMRESSVQRIVGNKILYETVYDEYREPKERKISIGDIRIQSSVKKSASGKIIEETWTTQSGDEVRKLEYGQNGFITKASISDKSYQMSYSEDGYLNSVNDLSFEYHSGGVMKRAAENYTVDGNGWILKRGKALLSYDAYGQISWAKLHQNTWHFGYDNHHRLISINKDGATIFLFYGLPNLPDKVSHFVLPTSPAVSTIFYTEDGAPFSALHNGYRYALATDSDASLRYILSENGLEKRIEYDPLGRIVEDTNSHIWMPIGFRGGIDIPELDISIVKGRPLDVSTGRYLSFSPKALVPSINCLGPLDLFSDNICNTNSIPTDIPSWLKIAGFSQSLLPSSSVGLLHLPYSPLSSRLYSSLEDRFELFSQLSSLRPSALLDPSGTASLPFEEPKWALDDATFSYLFLLDTSGNTTKVLPTPILSKDEVEILRALFEPNSVEINWQVFTSGRERHFVRYDAIPNSITSSAHPQFTIVVSKKSVEIRNAKAKITVHFEAEKESIEKDLLDELKKKESRSAWISEKKFAERGEKTRHNWTDAQKRELISRGAVRGFTPKWAGPLSTKNPRFTPIFLWEFSETPN
ncbi:hypothetical protein WR25_10770 [Diploscapter pachys]|uniref:EGF-like domain-containing protein n=1 Tax=Diploscapter pachys TaxID=2018661 RepID=A0A2A2JBD6_9BILA|nr:hypothetical protein WR25_10770 [Diploscapter pachys]